MIGVGNHFNSSRGYATYFFRKNDWFDLYSPHKAIFIKNYIDLCAMWNHYSDANERNQKVKKKYLVHNVHHIYLDITFADLLWVAFFVIFFRYWHATNGFVKWPKCQVSHSYKRISWRFHPNLLHMVCDANITFFYLPFSLSFTLALSFTFQSSFVMVSIYWWHTKVQQQQKMALVSKWICDKFKI